MRLFDTIDQNLKDFIMKKAILGVSLLATSLLMANEHQIKIIQIPHKQVDQQKHSSTHWGYTGHSAPQYWGDIDPKYAMCKQGLNQSPIDITSKVTVETKGLKPILFSYGADAKGVLNNGHSIQVNVDSYSSIDIDGEHFVLKQFHFHTPSENEIDGRSFPLEAHFVHVSDDGKLAVVGVLFELGESNKALQAIWDAMPKEAGKTNELKLSSKMIENLLPKNRDYYYFNGSLTTPPCSEGVKWMVMQNYLTISKEQVQIFLDVMHHPNNRPTMPINARKVFK
jgi:carbonic anhydrase